MGTCSALFYNLSSGTRLLLLRKEESASTKEHSGEVGSESSKSKIVDLRRVFDIDNSSLHYIRAAGNCQQIMAAKGAVQTSVVDRSIHFSWSEASWRSSSITQTKHAMETQLQITQSRQTR